MINLNKIKDQIAKQMPTAERWRCTECKGHLKVDDPELQTEGISPEDSWMPCESCEYGNGPTGLKNSVEDVLMEIIGELCKASSAPICEFNWEFIKNKEKEWSYKDIYENYFVGSRSYFLATAVLRILEVMVYKDEPYIELQKVNGYVPAKILKMIRVLSHGKYNHVINLIQHHCEHHSIPLDRHIEARIRYEQQLQL